MKLVSRSGKHSSQEHSQQNNIQLPKKLYGGDIQKDLDVLQQHLDDGSEKAQEAAKKIAEKIQSQFQQLQEQRKHIKLFSLKSPSHSKQNSQYYKSSGQNSKKIVAITGGVVALAAVATFMMSSIEPTIDPDQTNPPPVVTPDEIVCTLGIAHDNAIITVDGVDYLIDPDSIIMDFENDDDHAIDINGIFRSGDIDPSNYTPEMQLTQEEIQSFTSVYEIKPSFCEILGVEPGFQAYGYSQKTSKTDDEKIKLILPSNDGIKLDEISDSSLWYIDNINDLEEKQAMPNEYQRLITGNNVHLRQHPNDYTYSVVLDQIPIGSHVHLEGSEDSLWVRVRYGDKVGFVSNKYIANEATLPEAMVTTQNGGNLRLRNSDGKVLLEMPNGSIVKIITEGSDKSKILYEGREIGYASNDYLTKITHDNDLTNSQDDGFEH